MFASMSTPPPEPGTDTPPSGGEQAAADAGAIAKGALTGGTAGAVKAALKTKTGRNAVLGAAAIPVIAAVAITAMLSGASTGVASFKAGHDSMAQSVALADFGDASQLEIIQSAATSTGTDWRVLAAIVKAEQGKGGAGPYGVDLAAAGGGISADDAKDLAKESRFIGSALAAANRGTVSSLSNAELDAGAIDYTNPNGGTSRKLSTDPNMRAAQSAVKTQYVAAISKLPIKGNPAIANSIFLMAQGWALGQKASDGRCAAGSVTLGGTTTASLNDSQKNYAQYIINTAANRGMPQKAAVVALAVAAQESMFRMYWNPKVDGSEPLAPDNSAQGTDGYSVGLFQQQVNGNQFSWGTVSDAMDPTKSTNMFLDALARISGWDSLPVTVAAQKVQGSAFPDAYAKWESLATQLVTDLKPTGGGAFSDAAAAPASPSPSDSASASPSASPSASASSSPAAKVVDSSGCTTGVGSGTAGKGDDYPYREPVGGCAWCEGGPDAVDPWTLYKRECVSFVAWRMNVQMGWKEGQEYPFTPAKLGLGGFGNAHEWKGNLAKAGYATDNTPKVGSIAWWDSDVTTPSTITGDAGHVAVVAAVNGDGTITVEEYNFNPWQYGTRTIPAADVTGFIHVADIADTSATSSASPTATPSAK